MDHMSSHDEYTHIHMVKPPKVCGCYVVTFLNRTCVLIGMSFGEDQIETIIKTCLKEIELRHRNINNYSHSTVNTIERTFVSS